VPDVLANAGGVTVSHLEPLQNRQGEPWPQERVRERLSEAMGRSGLAVAELARDCGLTLREAAYVRALERLAEATAARGCPLRVGPRLRRRSFRKSLPPGDRAPERWTPAGPFGPAAARTGSAVAESLY
jgi:hypothetical protein